jgi:hypothetical protein
MARKIEERLAVLAGDSPFPTTMTIGLDDHSDEYVALYADRRGVSRV